MRSHGRGPAHSRFAWARRILRSTFGLALFFFVFLLPLLWAGLWWFGLPSVWTARLSQALGGDQVRVQIGRLWLHPLRGPVAENVRILGGDGRTLADLNRLTVSLDWADLLRGQVRVQAIDLRRATLSLPLEEDFSLDLTQVNARVLLPPGQLRIVHASGHWGAFVLRLSGQLTDPFARIGEWTAVHPTESTEDPVWKNILRELAAVEAERPVEIDLSVSGEWQDFSRLVVRGEWEGGPLHWREAFLRQTTGEFSLAKGLLRLGDFSVEDREGALTLSGEYDHSLASGEAFLRGSLDIRPWLSAFGMSDRLGDLQLGSAPTLEARVRFQGHEVPVEERLVVTGTGNLENFSVRDVPVDFFRFDFAWRPGLFLTRGARIEAPFLSAKVDAKLQEGMVSVRAEGSIDPTQCLPWLDQGMQRIFSQMEFAERGRARVELAIPLADSGAVQGRGTLALGPTAMRGAWIDGGTARVELGQRAVRYEDMEMRVGPLRGTGVFVYDFGNQEVRLEKIQSNLPPDLVLQWIDPRIAAAIEAYRFVEPPQVTADGVVDMADPTKTRLDIGVRAPAGLNYDLLGRNLTPSQVVADVLVRGRRLLVTVREGRLFDGLVRLRADVSLDENNRTYRLEAEAERWDFAALNQLYFGYTGSEGRMSGFLSYEAPMENQTMLQGTGSLRVQDGNVFAIPVLGPFSGIINTVLPGVGYQNARLATVDFTIGDQTIRTDNLEIIGNGFSLYGEGDIRFVADELDMRVRLNAQGVTGVFLLPVSKLFEYESEGTLSKPAWRPRNLPRELTGGGLVETFTQPVRQLFGGGGEVEKNREAAQPEEAPTTSSSAPRIRRRLR